MLVGHGYSHTLLCCRTMILRSIVVSFIFLHTAWSGCPFQNPFFFVDRPSVVTVVDSDGEMVADRFNEKQVDNRYEHVDDVTESGLAGARWRISSVLTTSR